MLLGWFGVFQWTGRVDSNVNSLLVPVSKTGSVGVSEMTVASM